MRYRVQFIIMLTLLVLVGMGVATYKVVRLNVPVFPGESVERWIIEARISFFAIGRQVKVSLALPHDEGEMGVPGVGGASLQYGFRKIERDGDRRAQWTAESKSGPQVLYYRLQTIRRGASQQVFRHAGPPPAVPSKPALEGPEHVAAQDILGSARRRSADVQSLSIELLSRLAEEPVSQEVMLLLRRYQDRSANEARVALMLELFHLEGIPANRVLAVELNERVSMRELIPLVEVFDGVQWLVFDPVAPSGNLRDNLFLWLRGDRPLFDVEGGENSRISFASMRDVLPSEEMTDLGGSSALISTIQSLPVGERGIFRFLVMVPIGAFIVVLMRNIVGVPTLGTFMPVLIALSLLEIGNLPAALLLFATIIAVGLYFRFLLSRLNLLVVPRVAACVVIVTLLMIFTSVVSDQMGSRIGLGITVFPMIILAWTIERMSLIWEEEGGRSAIAQIVGSLVVAFIAYLIMRQRVVQHWCFYFPELLLVLLAGILLIGRYTGYRLSELHRFRHFQRPVTIE